eukprot:882125_1
MKSPKIHWLNVIVTMILHSIPSNHQPLLTAIFTSNSQQVSQISSATVQRVVPGHSLATSFQSISIDKFLTGAGVDPVAKKRVDEITKNSLAKCDSNNDFAFHTFQPPTIINSNFYI